MLIQADATNLPYPDKLFHACVTSPPYWGLRKYLGDQGEEPLGLEPTPERHIERMVEVFREVRRVLREDGCVWLNYGDCFAGSGGENANTGLGSGDRSGLYRNNPRKTKIAQGSLMLMPHRLAIALQQPFMECKGCGHIAHQMKWGRFPNGRWICPSCEMSKGWTEETPGWIVRNDLVWWKRNPMPESVAGWRWERSKTKTGEEGLKKQETSVGSYDVISGGRGGNAVWEYGDDYVLRKSSWRHTRSHEYVFMLVKKPKYYCNQEAVREASIDKESYEGRRPRNAGQMDGDDPENYKFHGSIQDDGTLRSGQSYPRRNPRSVLDVPTAPYKGAHYATFPPKLIAPLIRASVPRRCCPECGMAWSPVVENTPEYQKILDETDWNKDRGESITDGNEYGYLPGKQSATKGTRVTDYRPTCECGVTQHEPGIVLDIFGGSGTTGMVAKQLMRRWVVMDISRPYLDEQAKIRTGTGAPSGALEGLPMFGGEDEAE